MTKDLDPRVQGFEKKLKLAGTVVVAVLAATVVILGGLTIITAGAVALGALAMVNFVPVAARWMALKKQQGLTALAETFSEETLRLDEQEEEQRVRSAETAFTNIKAELEGSIEELRQQRVSATEDELVTIDAQITQLEGVIQTQGEILAQQQADLVELKRLNRLLITFDRSARAMGKVRGAERNPEEQQRLVTARTAIKTRMRTEIAGQQVQAMRHAVGVKTTPPNTAQLGHSEPVVLPIHLKSKEKVNVPTRR